MKREGIPFINEELTPDKEELKGFYPALIQKINGSFKGFSLISLCTLIEGDSRDISLGNVLKLTGGDSRDISLGNVLKLTEGDSRDISLGNVLKLTGGDSYGIELFSILNYVKNSSRGLKGAIYNRHKNAKDFLVNFGLVNIVLNDIDDETFLMQIGLYNRMGDTAYPLLNLKNIKKLKSGFKKYVENFRQKITTEKFINELITIKW